MTPVVWDAVVIGTGPSSLATVAALLERGIRPVVLESSLDEFSTSSPAPTGVAKSVGFKTWNGSDAMYRSHPHSSIRYDDGLTVRAANYLGGLSRVWGATNDRYREFRHWPRECIPVEGDWAAVADFVPRMFTGQAAPPKEAEARVLPMESRLAAFEAGLPAQGPYDLQASSLAIETRLGSSNLCDAAGTCLQGCARESIWWAGASFRDWARDGLIALHTGVLVESLKEQQGGDLVSLRLVDVSGARSEVDCRRVFVAAGAVATGAIILSSGLADRITVRDSQTAFGAMVSARRSRKAQPTHTLSHLWARERGGTEFLAQIYPPDRSHAARVVGKLPGVPPRVVDGLIGRLYPFIAYLDSDHSGTLVLSRSGRTVIVSPGREGDRRMMIQHLRRLAKQAARAGFLLPYFASDLATQGGGFHFGASLPHGTGSDAWGRPFGLQRVHVVDASVLPHIEAGSITPTVMANAHRIARTAS